MFLEPRIPQNTGNAIRLAAGTGATLHLVEPLGFDLTEPKLKRAGLDYHHDLATVEVHPDLDTALATAPLASRGCSPSPPTRALVHGRRVRGRRRAAVRSRAHRTVGGVLSHDRVTDRLRFPLVGGRRSLNLANSASVVINEAWRQQGFPRRGVSRPGVSGRGR